jgi:hypothetical protein
MTVARAVVSRDRFGYVLLPGNREAIPIVAYLYCPLDNYLADYCRERQRGIMGARSARDFIGHVAEVARSHGVRTQLGGTRRRPVLRMYPSVQSDHHPILRRSVDLKWSAWTDDESIWDERHPGILDEMRAAFSGDGPVVEITSCPKKEERSGLIEISKGRAVGSFSAAWGDLDDLADTLGLLDEDGHWKDRTGMTAEELAERDQDHWDDLDREAFAESIPFSQESTEPGMDHHFDVRAATFDDLMMLVDAQEAKLMEIDDQAWSEIESLYKQDAAAIEES